MRNILGGGGLGLIASLFGQFLAGPGGQLCSQNTQIGAQGIDLGALMGNKFECPASTSESAEGGPRNGDEEQAEKAEAEKREAFHL